MGDNAALSGHSVPLQAGVASPARYHLIMPVWNKKYIDLFVRYALPTQLTPGNLHALPAEKCLYQIFTRRQDADLIRSAPAYRELAQIMPVSIELLEESAFERGSYHAMTEAYERGIAHSKGVDTAFLFLTPDCLWSDGTFQAVENRLAEGKRAVLTLGLRACLPEVVAELDARLRDESSDSLVLTAREQMHLALTYLHPLSRAHLCEGKENYSVGHYYWLVENKALVARCFHLHPLMVRPILHEQKIYTTLDHEFVRLSCPYYEDVHIVTDSDELCSVELSEKDHLADFIRKKPVTAQEFTSWMDLWTNSYHRRFLTHPIVLHSGERPEGISRVLRESERFVREILSAFVQRHPSPPEGMQSVWGNPVLHPQLNNTNPAPGNSTSGTASPKLLGRAYHAVRSRVRDLVKRLYRFVNKKLYARIENLEAALAVESYARVRADDQMDVNIRRLLNLLGQTGSINFAYQDPSDPTNQPPLSYHSWDHAYFVYRPVFARVMHYLKANRIDGDVVEFGTYRGFTARCLAEAIVSSRYDGSLHLYDSFEGLPAPSAIEDVGSYEVVANGWSRGAMALEAGIEHEIHGSLVKILDRSRVRIVKGYFEHTLEHSLPSRPVALVHVDCDLYSSTRNVLDKLAEKELLQDGCVVIFDDYNCNSANPSMGERAALQTFLAEQLRWDASPWFSYGWHGQVHIFHDRQKQIISAPRAQGEAA